MFDVRARKAAWLYPSLSLSVLRLQEGDGTTPRRPDQYYILAPEKTPEEMQTEAFCLSEHQNTATFPFLSESGKIDGSKVTSIMVLIN